MNKILKIQNLTKNFGNVSAVSNVSIEVEEGTIHSIIGPNGAGKSTLIKLLSGVHIPSEGEILLSGEPVNFKSPRQAVSAGIGTVYQDLALQPLMSVTRNFFLGREITKGLFLNMPLMNTITKKEMAKLGIDVADPTQPIGTMSGGQRQTLAIARAIYFGANVLILDEPTSALGQKQQLEVLRTIKKVKELGDIAIIFITHNDMHAKLLGDRFAFLNRGKVLAEGSRDEIDMNNLRPLMAGGAELEKLETEFSGR